MHRVKIVVERHDDGYVAYPLGIEGAIVGEGDSFDEALADVKSAIAAYAQTFGSDSLDTSEDVLEVFVGEAGIQG
jgi:predicted RNase H-like HicB family nuclease